MVYAMCTSILVLLLAPLASLRFAAKSITKRLVKTGLSTAVPLTKGPAKAGGTEFIYRPGKKMTQGLFEPNIFSDVFGRARGLPDQVGTFYKMSVQAKLQISRKIFSSITHRSPDHWGANPSQQNLWETRKNLPKPFKNPSSGSKKQNPQTAFA